ncbi:phosphate-starvation-inducible PsiE family protein [uncultured Halomonas sp.]|uniref:phosphate-starvation-inducible PsiE family protein n=1 Tax=Halomonas mongoliensis TaxID=321265 RepID=UPI002627F99A|nr:phosphate-starvation-inducible PsiE family protein [uncultured Halomonas sp.]
MEQHDQDARHGPRLLHDELPKEHEDPLIRRLHLVIRQAIKLLAVLMVLVIIWGVLDVIYVLYTKFVSPPVLLFEVSDIFVIFGAFMVVLIAVEIFINIRLYLGTNILPIRLVVATALMAIARKVIILDIATVTAMEMLAIAAVVLALGVTHWLVGKPD